MQLLKSSIYLHTLTIKVSLSDKNDRTTVGFVQVRLEVVAIITNNIAAFVQAGQTLPNIGSKYLSLAKAWLRLRAEGILMPHLRKALSLAVSNLKLTSS